MANVTRVNLTGDYAVAVELAARQQGVSQAEITRQGLRALWGANLENAPKPTLNGSTVQPVTQPVNVPTVQPPASSVSADDLFSCGA